MKIKYVPLYAALIAFATILACSPERYVPACFEGMALWAKCVAPALFPFMVITMLLIKTGGAKLAAGPFERAGKFLGLPPAAAVIFVMSAVSGYPAGSRIVCEYCERGEISPDDARRLAPLCSTSGPLFIIGSVGQNMFGNKAYGAAALAAHLVSVIAVGLAICLIKKKDAQKTCAKRLTTDGGNILYDVFYSAVISVLVAGGFICFFFTLSRAAQDFNVLLPLEWILTPLFDKNAANFCYGLIEATGGCAGLAAEGGVLALPLAGFLITFGGASILAQQLCYLTKCGVKPTKFILAKCAQGALCFALLLPLAL